MLVVFKSAPILKRTLKVKHAMMQLYVLKLLKMQTKYLGRQWRKSNMKTMSAIYTKVRHRLNDDWAFGNGENCKPLRLKISSLNVVFFPLIPDVDSRPWDFQAEECALRAAVDRFNYSRYGRGNPPDRAGGKDPSVPGAAPGVSAAAGAAAAAAASSSSDDDFEYEPVDNCLSSVLGQEVELTDEFKRNYERWLHKEVYGMEIQWELLLDDPNAGEGGRSSAAVPVSS